MMVRIEVMMLTLGRMVIYLLRLLNAIYSAAKSGFIGLGDFSTVYAR